MIFNTAIKGKVGYFIHPNSKLPLFLFQAPEKINQNEVNCPAVATLNNRIFGIKPLLSVDLEFGVQKNIKDELEPYIKYELDPNVYRDQPLLHEWINQIIIIDMHDSKATIQFQSMYVYATDVKDLEIIQLPPHKNNFENCYFINGAFNISKWTRALSGSYMQIDNTKPAKVKLNLNDYFYNIMFSKPIKLEEIKPNKNTLLYYSRISDIANTYNKIKKVIPRIVKHRPKKLL